MVTYRLIGTNHVQDLRKAQENLQRLVAHEAKQEELNSNKKAKRDIQW